MDGAICIPELLDANKKRLLTQHVSASPNKRAKKDGHRTTQERNTHSAHGETKTITTQFCHPIAFNAEQPCHFCDGSAVAIRGLGEGYIDQLRMCLPCTMDRAGIATCRSHEMRPIAGQSMETLDFSAAFTALLEGAPRAEDQWCSLCPNLALHQCVAGGPISKSDAELDDCGMLLCECCNSMLEVYGGDLQAMLGELQKGSSEEHQIGFRADVELLKRDGLLMRYVQWASQQ